jgi:hypothetical protein
MRRAIQGHGILGHSVPKSLGRHHNAGPQPVVVAETKMNEEKKEGKACVSSLFLLLPFLLCFSLN